MARFSFLASICAIITVPALAQNSAAPSADSGALASEVRALRAEIAVLTAQLEKLGGEVNSLRRTLSEKQDPDWSWPSHLPWNDSRGPNMSALEQIHLRPGATPAEVREYVSAIVRASANQNMWSDMDPQTEMLTRVGRANVPILLEFLGSGPGHSYVLAAVCQLAEEEHKGLILAKLPFSHELIRAVLRNGWEAEAMPILLNVLKKGPPYLPKEWIDAIVQAQDPSTNDALIDHFIQGSNRSQTFESLRALKDVPLDEAVALAWDRAQYGHEWERDSMAAIAAGYGHLDALEHVATVVRAGSAHDFSLPQMQRALVEHVAERGPAREVAEWVLNNKDHLVWDAQAKEFRRR